MELSPDDTARPDLNVPTPEFFTNDRGGDKPCVKLAIPGIAGATDLYVKFTATTENLKGRITSLFWGIIRPIGFSNCPERSRDRPIRPGRIPRLRPSNRKSEKYSTR